MCAKDGASQVVLIIGLFDYSSCYFIMWPVSKYFTLLNHINFIVSFREPPHLITRNRFKPVVKANKKTLHTDRHIYPNDYIQLKNYTFK